MLILDAEVEAEVGFCRGRGRICGGFCFLLILLLLLSKKFVQLCLDDLAVLFISLDKTLYSNDVAITCEMELIESDSQIT